MLNCDPSLSREITNLMALRKILKVFYSLPIYFTIKSPNGAFRSFLPFPLLKDNSGHFKSNENFPLI